jgi:hypothetical protein
MPTAPKRCEQRHDACGHRMLRSGGKLPFTQLTNQEGLEPAETATADESCGRKAIGLRSVCSMA